MGDAGIEIPTVEEIVQAGLRQRVCRGCKWLRGQRCQALGLFGENVLYVDTEQDGRHHPLIHRPDDFGCNKWEAKP